MTKKDEDNLASSPMRDIITVNSD